MGPGRALSLVHLLPAVVPFVADAQPPPRDYGRPPAWGGPILMNHRHGPPRWFPAAPQFVPLVCREVKIEVPAHGIAEAR